jgi:hypothetical protein
VAEAFDQPQWATFVDGLLDAFADDPTSVAYDVLHGITVPWNYSIGDNVGLMPLSYIARANYYREPYPVGRNWELAAIVADRYILGWPKRLPDGTVSRDQGWDDQPDVNASFLWNDDQAGAINSASCCC